MAINQTHLRAFYRVALDGGFSKAAQNLNISQPTLSSQVAALEERYGVHLFDRRGRVIELTPSGIELFEICQRIFNAVTEAEDLLSGFSDMMHGDFRFYADSPIYAVRLIARFREKYPGPHVELTIANYAQVRASLENSMADMAIMAGSPPAKGFGSMRVARYPLVALVPNHHRWAGQKEISMEELLQQTLLMREAGSMTREALENGLEKAGMQIENSITIGSREAVREGVAQNLGIGVVSEPEFGGDSRMQAVRINHPRITMEEHLVWPKDRARTRIGKAMLSVARDMTNI